MPSIKKSGRLRWPPEISKSLLILIMRGRVTTRTDSQEALNAADGKGHLE